MEIDIASFLKRYTGFIPEETFMDILRKQLNGESSCSITEDAYNETLKKLQEYKLWNTELSEVSYYQNLGMDYERKNDLENAVKSYEKAITLGEESPRIKINNYLHSVERLAIVYRKLKRYDDEVRVILIGLKYQDVNPSDNYYVRLRKRLAKAESLLNK